MGCNGFKEFKEIKEFRRYQATHFNKLVRAIFLILAEQV